MSCRFIPSLLSFLALVAVAGNDPIVASASGTPLFESRCDTLSEWDILDLREPGTVVVETDSTVPKGYGPQVLHVKGHETLLMAKGIRFREGTLVALWKDIDPVAADCDGVILFQAHYPDDIAPARNTKEHQPHYWIEQDSDTGFQIKVHRDVDKDVPLIEHTGVGKTQDDWNKTGWIWQKLSLSSEGLKAKFWSAVLPEPEEWEIEDPEWKVEEGRVGLKVFSGDGSIAYFAVSATDINPHPPMLDMSSSKSLWLTHEVPDVRLFVNFSSPIPLSTLFLGCESARGERITRGVEVPFPAGHTQIDFEKHDGADPFPFPSPIPEGSVVLTAELQDSAQRTVASVSREMEFRSTDFYRKRFEDLRKRVNDQIVDDSLIGTDRVLEAVSASALLTSASERFSSDKIPAIDRTLAYVEEALDSKITIEEYTCDEVHIPASSFVMGETYTVTLDWRSLIQEPDDRLVARLQISDDWRVEIPVSVDAAIAQKDWQKGKCQTRFTFRVPEESPVDMDEPVSRPGVREGHHLLWISLWGNGGEEPVCLDLPDPDVGDFATRYQIGRLYITQNPVELGMASFQMNEEGRLSTFDNPLRNTSSSEIQCQVVCQIKTESGTVLKQDVKSIALPAGAETTVRHEFSDCCHFGSLSAEIRLFQEGRLLTQAEVPIEIPAPEGWQIAAGRRNKSWIQNGRPYTDLFVVAIPPENLPAGQSVKIQIHQNGEDWGFFEKTPDKNGGGLIEMGVLPCLGTYQVAVTIPDATGCPWTREFRVLAPVFEIVDGNLYLNGEPFIVKGVNCHGMIPQSPRRTRLMMQILKDIGFNMVRGDYPSPWQVDMAQEENLGYMPLAPFSCIDTDNLKKRHAPHPMPRMREITRRFIQIYKGKPATWFWNSCNEVTGEIDDFLTMTHPLYRAMDPYGRPVIYANLGEQDRTVGQDVMGINYYYDFRYDLEQKQPLVLSSIEKAQQAGLPCIYNEYNCWHGPVYSEGANAVRGFFEFGLEHGMSGGFLYQLRDQIPRHPGVVSDDNRLWTNPTFTAALRRAFADATIAVGDRTTKSISLRVENVRPFTLREVRYEIREGGRLLAEGTMTDLAPQESGDLTLEVTGGTDSHVLDVDVWFVTHFGIKEHITETICLEKRE